MRLRTLLRFCFEREAGRCFWCDQPTTMTSAKERDCIATVDHIIPQRERGGDEPENVVLACWRCNNERGSLPAEAYLYRVHGRRAMTA
jgi:5-methylcytosine-specific restriction endonuclease McrA